jgi:hypothetical protein
MPLLTDLPWEGRYIIQRHVHTENNNIAGKKFTKDTVICVTFLIQEWFNTKFTQFTQSTRFLL